MASEPLDINIRIPTPTESIQKIADTFEKRVGKSLEKSINKLGLAEFKPVAQGANGGGSGKAVAAGVAAGIAAGGVITALNLIVDALSGMPIITAIMKILKLIMVMLLLPLQPVLKPALDALIEVAAWIKQNVVPKSNAQSEGAQMGAIVGGGVGAIAGGVGAIPGAILGGILGSIIADPMNKAMKWLVDTLYDLGGAIAKFSADIVGIFYNFGGMIVGAAQWIWDNCIVGPWSAALEWVKQIWNLYLQPVWATVSGWGQQIWDLIKQPFQDVANAIKSAVNAIKNLGGTVASGVVDMAKKALGITDGVISGGRIITTDPNDFLIATKNPAALGGGGSITINIDKPTIRSEADMKALVKDISQAIYTAQRRSNSYV